MSTHVRSSLLHFFYLIKDLVAETHNQQRQPNGVYCLEQTISNWNSCRRCNIKWLYYIPRWNQTNEISKHISLYFSIKCWWLLWFTWNHLQHFMVEISRLKFRMFKFSLTFSSLLFSSLPLSSLSFSSLPVISVAICPLLFSSLLYIFLLFAL